MKHTQPKYFIQACSIFLLTLVGAGYIATSNYTGQVAPFGPGDGLNNMELHRTYLGLEEATFDYTRESDRCAHLLVFNNEEDSSEYAYAGGNLCEGSPLAQRSTINLEDITSPIVWGNEIELCSQGVCSNRVPVQPVYDDMRGCYALAYHEFFVGIADAYNAYYNKAVTIRRGWFATQKKRFFLETDPIRRSQMNQEMTEKLRTDLRAIVQEVYRPKVDSIKEIYGERKLHCNDNPVSKLPDFDGDSDPTTPSEPTTPSTPSTPTEPTTPTTPTSGGGNPMCGNGVVESGETCDDSNQFNGDGCTGTCQVEACGNGTLDAAFSSSATRTTEVEILIALADAPLDIDGDGNRNPTTDGILIARWLQGVRNEALITDAIGPNATRTTLNSVVAYLTEVESQLDIDGDGQTIIATDGSLIVRHLFGFTGTTLLGLEQCDDSNTTSGDGCSASCQAEETSALGSLRVTPGDIIATRQIIGGQTSTPLLLLDFAATGEDIKVEDVRLHILSNSEVIDSLELVNTATNESIGIATPNNCPNGTPAGIFCFRTEEYSFTVADNTTMPVAIQAFVKRDVAGGLSGKDIVIELEDGIHNLDAIMAEGVTSNVSLQANNNDGTLNGEVLIGTTDPAEENITIRSTNHHTVMSKITTVTNANPDADGTTIPSGPHPIGQFNFTTLEHSNTENNMNDVVLDDLIFTVKAENILFNQEAVYFYNKVENEIKTPCRIEGSAPDYTAHCTGLVDSIVNTEIDAGDTGTFVLELDITNIYGNAAAQVALTNLGTSVADTVGTNEGQSHIRWIDTDNLTEEQFMYIEDTEDVVSTQYVQEESWEFAVARCAREQNCITDTTFEPFETGIEITTTIPHIKRSNVNTGDYTYGSAILYKYAENEWRNVANLNTATGWRKTNSTYVKELRNSPGTYQYKIAFIKGRVNVYGVTIPGSVEVLQEFIATVDVPDPDPDVKFADFSYEYNEPDTQNDSIDITGSVGAYNREDHRTYINWGRGLQRFTVQEDGTFDFSISKRGRNPGNKIWVEYCPVTMVVVSAKPNRTQPLEGTIYDKMEFCPFDY